MSNDVRIDHELSDSAFVSDHGERVTHLSQNPVFYGHLSIYHFAAQFAYNAAVLDAGCGAGYGSNYLAAAGAALVHGIDVSAKAVAFSQYHFKRANLDFSVMDLSSPLGFPDGCVDLVVSSNTLEHIANVQGFLREVRRLLKPGGHLLVAVPPITTDGHLYKNLANPYHVNIWSPCQWAHTLGKYFRQVEPYMHGIGRLGSAVDLDSPRARHVTEYSFVFGRARLKDMYHRATVTAIFVASQPRSVADLPAIDAPPDYVDTSFTRPAGYIDPALRRRLKKYFKVSELSPIQKAIIIGRKDGFGAVLRGAVEYAKRGFRAPPEP